jgi:hypothetical protein
LRKLSRQTHNPEKFLRRNFARPKWTTIIADDKEKVLERLKENTGVQISAREHQGIEELGINMIGAQVKKESDKSAENQAAKAKKNYLHDTALTKSKNISYRR